MPTHSHPIWSLLRMIAIGVLLIVFLYAFYDRLDQRDLSTVLGTLVSLAGFDLIQSRLGRNAPERQSQANETQSQ